MRIRCRTCGKEFEAKGNTKTCSQECSPTPHKERKSLVGRCVVCGREFPKSNNQKTCGPACAQQNKRDYQNAYYLRPDRQAVEKERAKKRWAAHEPITATCSVCGGPFAKTTRSTICSDDCREAMRQRWADPDAIEPFPSEEGRDAFGHWVSGFTDGEGSFMLRALHASGLQKWNALARFNITLRADDLEILVSIRQFFGCGRLREFANWRRGGILNAKPVAVFSVTNAADLVAKVIPHFDTFPLRAKKRRDYAIWREGVLLLEEVSARPAIPRPVLGGFFPKWTDAERDQFQSLCDALRDQRRYVHPNASSEPAGDEG